MRKNKLGHAKRQLRSSPLVTPSPPPPLRHPFPCLTLRDSSPTPSPPPAISRIRKLRITDGQMDGWTKEPKDQQTDGPTDRPSYRDARTHLKIEIEVFNF